MNPVSGPALLAAMSKASSLAGLVGARTRRRRAQWQETIEDQSAQALRSLGRSVSVTERWEILAGCGSAWAWKEGLSWGGEPNIAMFDGFVDAINTAESEEQRRDMWEVWPSLVGHALEQEDHWLRYVLRSLAKVEVWAPGEAKRLGLNQLLLDGDWQAPVFMEASGPRTPLTPLQYAWQEDKPGLCRVMLESGADGHAVSRNSLWPSWSLARCFEGRCEGDEPTLMARSEVHSIQSLKWASNSFAHRMTMPCWLELMEYQQPANRRHMLEKQLPAAESRLSSPSVRF